MLENNRFAEGQESTKSFSLEKGSGQEQLPISSLFPIILLIIYL